MKSGAEIDQLYGLRPDDFVRARNALAARLRRGGRTGDAASVRRLRKPTAAVWAINQAAREEPERVKDFLDAFDHLRRAQASESRDLPQAIERERSARQRLLDRAIDRLTAHGSSVPAGIVRRLSATLRGAAGDADARSDLRRGRLTQEHQAPGFELLVGDPVRRGRGATTRPATMAAAVGRREQARRTREDARSQREAAGAATRETRQREAVGAAAREVRQQEAVRAAAREGRQRQRRAEALERLAAARRRATERLEQRVQKVTRRLQDLERQVAEHRQAAERATKEAQRAREEARRTFQADGGGPSG